MSTIHDEYIDERNPEIGEDQVLDALKRARTSVAEAPLALGLEGDADEKHPWLFSSWATCSCGHIYLAAVGSPGVESDIIEARRVDGLYEEVMKAVVRANPAARSYARDAYVYDPLAVAVSNATSTRARSLGDGGHEDDDVEYNESRRRGALDLIDAAIARIEASHEAARRELLNGDDDDGHEAVLR